MTRLVLELQTEAGKLKQKTDFSENNLLYEKDISKITQLKIIKLPVGDISTQIKFKIDALEIELNQTLKKAIVSINHRAEKAFSD